MQSRAVHNWFLRFCALIVFVSGGALAQRLAQEIDTQLIPLEFPREKHMKAVMLEVRQPEPVQIESALPPAHTEPASPQGLDLKPLPQLEIQGDQAALRTFDALAPPQN
jgi:hypothetical protein